MWGVGSPVVVVPEFRPFENPTFSTESAKSGQSHWDWAGALKARPASVLECLAMYSFAE